MSCDNGVFLFSPRAPGMWRESCRCKATWKGEFKVPWREAGPPNHHDFEVDSDQKVVNEELSL